MSNQAEIRMLYHPPFGDKHFEAAFKLDSHTHREIFSPLPRDRELPWAFESRKRADAQLKKRRQIAIHIAERFLEEIAAHDPVNGYEKE